MNTNTEIWKDISGYEGLYQISNLGKVKSMSRKVEFTNRWGQRITRAIKTKYNNIATSNSGYKRVFLSKNDIIKPFSIHRLVAIHFIPNPENKPQVNHKDGDKSNNTIVNLEWCTQNENQRHAYEYKLNVPKKGFEDSQSKQIYMYSVEGELINVFGSYSEANRSGFPRTCVRRVCDGIKETYKGYKFSLHAQLH